MSDTLILLGLLALMVAAIVGAVHLGIQEQEQWDAFAATHECRVVERIKSTTKEAWMPPTPPVQAIARGRLPRPSQPCVARPARGASGGK